MARKPITISVPDWLQLYIEDRVKGSAYASVSEYVRELLREDMRRLNSGTPAPIPDRRFQPLASAARRR